MRSIGMPELIVILVFVTAVFGARKLPRFGEDMGKAIQIFKDVTEKKKIDVTYKKTEEIPGESKR